MSYIIVYIPLKKRNYRVYELETWEQLLNWLRQQGPMKKMEVIRAHNQPKTRTFNI